jgi:hypothetical protein
MRWPVVLLAFVVGVVVGCAVMSWLGTESAQAQPQPPVKWEQKFFAFHISGAGEDNQKALKEINEGNWEYSGFATTNAGGMSYPLFKRAKK